MPKYTQTDVDQLLEEWSKIKSKISSLEAKQDQCKKIAEKMMRQENTDVLQSDGYILIHRQNTRTSLSKKDAPEDVWTRYAKQTTYSTYNLTSKKRKIGDSDVAEKDNEK